MSQDVLTHIADSITHYREGARRLCKLGGITPPETEQEWLKFSLNQSLRTIGTGKPLPWNPPADPQPTE